MLSLSASELLAVWERGRVLSTTEQALMLLKAASPDSQPEELARLSIGRRDARLLSLREQLFGSSLTGVAACPQCGQKIELTFDAADIRADADSVPPATLTASSGHYVAEFRLVNSEDLTAMTGSSGAERDLTATTRALFSRCLLKVRRKGRRQALESSSELPPELIAAVAEEMEKADPQANVYVELSCADCGHRWVSPFDIVSFLLREIDSWARHVVREVCLLASAFGWRETDILAMTAERRSLYIETIAR